MLVVYPKFHPTPVETVESFRQGFEHYSVIMRYPTNPHLASNLRYRRLTTGQLGIGLRKESQMRNFVPKVFDSFDSPTTTTIFIKRTSHWKNFRLNTPPRHGSWKSSTVEISPSTALRRCQPAAQVTEFLLFLTVQSAVYCLITKHVPEGGTRCPMK